MQPGAIRRRVLAVDYDGTLAEHGLVAAGVIAALERLAASGRRLILVTGRRLQDLLDMFPAGALFDRIVGENGAVLYRPKTRESRLLCPPVPPAFLQFLEGKGLAPLEVGSCIVATVHPNETTVLEAIRELGLELHVIFNKGAVMVLPAGVTKALGLKAALGELALSGHETVALGDAENDHALLEAADFSAAVASAIPTLKERADYVTAGGAGAGAVELIDAMIRDDLQALAAHSPRAAARAIRLGTGPDGAPVYFPPSGPRLLVTGSSGGGKSTLASTLLLQLLRRGYQCCVFDPEGDYEGLYEREALSSEGFSLVELGDVKRAPSPAEVAAALNPPGTSVIVNLLAVEAHDRPDYMASILPKLQALRAGYARPHWILIDEAHHSLPAGRRAPGLLTGPEGYSVIYVTVRPRSVAAEVLAAADVVATVGAAAAETLAEYCRAIGIEPPPIAQTAGTGKARAAADGSTASEAQAHGEVLLWMRGGRPVRFELERSASLHHRHLRKYAEGKLEPDRSFYFRGPKGALNLRAQNLSLFVQLAGGIDDETWQYHLRRGDYSDWLRTAIKDETLAKEAASVEALDGLSIAESRQRILSAVKRRYTLPEEDA